MTISIQVTPVLNSVSGHSVICVPSAQIRKRILLVLLLSAISACSIAPQKSATSSRSQAELAKIPDAVPKVEPRSKHGNMRTYEVFEKRYYVLESGDGFTQKGIASWYGPKFHGKKTSNGEVYDMYAMTAAHKTLPLPSYLEGKNLENGRKIIVRVNDRGPFHDNRVVDLSYTAAIKLGMIAEGTALVEIRAINPRTHRGGGSPVRTRPEKPGKSKVLDFYIQVGVFSEFNNAERLKYKLQVLNTPITVEPTMLDSGVAFRVKIGPLNNIEVADEIVTRLGLFDIYDHRILLE